MARRPPAHADDDGENVSLTFILRFKCARCGEVWRVLTSPPKPEPASCCPRCASFVREFAGLEETQKSIEAGRHQDHPAPSKMQSGRRSQGRSSPSLDRLH
jgi:hypothetical protein